MDETPAERRPASKPQAIRALAMGAIVGALLTAGFLLVVGVLVFRQTLPPLTATDYEAAVERWRQHGPKSYDSDIEVIGNRPGQIHIEVRGGEVQQMTRDGIEPKQRRTWDYWSVDGQLDTIGQELEMARDPEHAFGATANSSVLLYAQFDAELGYPLVYRRNVLGAQQDMMWKVTRFEPLK